MEKTAKGILTRRLSWWFFLGNHLKINYQILRGHLHLWRIHQRFSSLWPPIWLSMTPSPTTLPKSSTMPGTWLLIPHAKGHVAVISGWMFTPRFSWTLASNPMWLTWPTTFNSAPASTKQQSAPIFLQHYQVSWPKDCCWGWVFWRMLRFHFSQATPHVGKTWLCGWHRSSKTSFWVHWGWCSTWTFVWSLCGQPHQFFEDCMQVWCLEQPFFRWCLESALWVCIAKGARPLMPTWWQCMTLWITWDRRVIKVSRWTPLQSMIQPLFWFLLGNAENYASQHGCLIMLTDARATDVTTHARLIDWKSSRSGRVCRSTLAAEASAADTSVDRSSFCNLMLSEILQKVPSFRITTPLRMIQVTDCKTVW